jgi:hypothetical protein
MMLRRRVDPGARVCCSPASTPAARSRLWTIAAHRIQAYLAPKRPEGVCASGPSMTSTCRRDLFEFTLRGGALARLLRRSTMS